jgi:DTW domain-containing protein YfiP
METRTRFLFLMSPKEFKIEKSNTGRLTHLCLPNSELHMGTEYDRDESVQAILNDSQHYCVLLYPGKTATDLSNPAESPRFESEIGQRKLVVILIDATWRDARKIHRLSPSLQRLPCVRFTPSTPSRFIIKKQPRADCLSTLEATHELLLLLSRAGLDQYPEPKQLLDVFQRMQDFQIQCARDPSKKGYHRHACTQITRESGGRLGHQMKSIQVS